MKKYFLLIILFYSFSYSQKYFLLDDIKSNFEVKEYTLNTRDIYNINRKINVYNVFVSKNNILLLSVLPNLEPKENNWRAIDEKDFLEKTISKNQILNLTADFLENNTNEKKTLEYNLVKKENGKYFVSKSCLLEFFNVGNYLYPIISKESVINISEKVVSIKKMKKTFEKQFPNENFIIDVRNNGRTKVLDYQYVFRNYLSKKFIIKKQKAYQFWTFDGWWITDGYNIHRGIDRFVYVPKLGIIGGSYDFYFELKPKISSNDYYFATKDMLWSNMINEKIMIAEELK